MRADIINHKIVGGEWWVVNGETGFGARDYCPLPYRKY